MKNRINEYIGNVVKLLRWSSLSLSLSLSPVTFLQAKDDNATRDIVKRINNTVNSYTPISQTDIPYTISRPGNYRLIGNISYSGAGAAITNNGNSNVDFDLNGFTVDLQGTGNTAFLIRNADNIHIYGGNIVNGNLNTTAANTVQYYVFDLVNFTINTDSYNTSYNPNPASLNLQQAGISLAGCSNVSLFDLSIDSFLYGILSQQTGSNYYIENNTITNCGNPSVTVPNPYIQAGATPPTYDAPATLNEPIGASIIIAGTSSTSVLSAPTPTDLSNNIVVTNNNLYSNNSYYGLLLISCSEMTILNNEISSGRPAISPPIVVSGGLNTVPATLNRLTAGIEFINCQFGTIENCKTSGSYNAYEVSWGVGFMFKNNKGTDFAHNGLGYNNVYYSNAYYMSLERGSGNETQSPVINGSGIKFNNSIGCLVDHCDCTNWTQGTSTEPVTPNPVSGSNGYGIVLYGCKSSTVQYCTATNNSGGFYEAPGTNPPNLNFKVPPGVASPLFAGSQAVLGTPYNDQNAWRSNIAINNFYPLASAPIPNPPYPATSTNYNLPPYQDMQVSSLVDPSTYYPGVVITPWTNIAVPY